MSSVRTRRVTSRDLVASFDVVKWSIVEGLARNDGYRICFIACGSIEEDIGMQTRRYTGFGATDCLCVSRDEGILFCARTQAITIAGDLARTIATLAFASILRFTTGTEYHRCRYGIIQSWLFVFGADI